MLLKVEFAPHAGDSDVGTARETLVLASLFPGGIIHIGGDEVRYKKYWEGVPHIEAFMKKKGIKTFPDLQIMFTNRISGMLAERGRRMMGWNEILGSDVHNDGGRGAALGKLDASARL